MMRDAITDSCIAFISASRDHLNEFNALIEESESWLEELFLDTKQKFIAQDNYVLLPKTPAKVKQKGRRGRAARLQELAEDVENKENLPESEQSELPSSYVQFSTPPSNLRSRRTASKAATAKIKEATRKLNNLASKLRRPESTDESSVAWLTASTERVLGEAASVSTVEEKIASPSKVTRAATITKRMADESARCSNERSGSKGQNTTSKECRIVLESNLLELQNFRNSNPKSSIDCETAKKSLLSTEFTDINKEESLKRTNSAHSSDAEEPLFKISRPSLSNVDIGRITPRNSSVDSGYETKRRTVRYSTCSSDANKNNSLYLDSVEDNSKKSSVAHVNKVNENTTNFIHPEKELSQCVNSDDHNISVKQTEPKPENACCREISEFKRPLLPKSVSEQAQRVSPVPAPRVTRTNIKNLCVRKEAEAPANGTKKRTIDHVEGSDSLLQPVSQSDSSVFSSSNGRMTRTKKRKVEQVAKEAENDANCSTTSSLVEVIESRSFVQADVCLILSDSDSEVELPKEPAIMKTKGQMPVHVSTTNAQSGVKKIVKAADSPLRQAIIESAASPKGINKKYKQTLDISCVSSANSQVSVMSDSSQSSRPDRSEEQCTPDEEFVEKKILHEKPTRITRSKVRQQQQQAMLDKANLVVQISNSKLYQAASAGQFSPRPFSSRTGVKQLAAAYTEHISSVATPQKKPMVAKVLSSSSLRNGASTTPLLKSRLVQSALKSGFSTSSDAHHYKRVSKVMTPSQASRPKNLVTGVRSFLPNSVVHSLRPTKEDKERQRLEEARRKEEKQQEICRKKEELLKQRGEEAKRRNEERMRKVQEARQAQERKQATLMREKEARKRADEEAARKRAAEEEAARRLAEEEARRRAELEAAERRALLRKQEEERRYEEERKKEQQEQKRREEEAKREERRAAEEKKREELRAAEEKRREESRVAEERKLKMAEILVRKEEELRLLNEQEAARLAAQRQVLKHVLNETYDAGQNPAANATYITSSVSKTPTTPANTCTSSKRQDSYEMTPLNNSNDYGIDDLRSDDSSDDEAKPKKRVPKWAKRVVVIRGLVEQEFSRLVPDIVFPQRELLLMPDLSKIFQIEKTRFKIRSSSAHWTTPPHKVFHCNRSR